MKKKKKNYCNYRIDCRSDYISILYFHNDFDTMNNIKNINDNDNNVI